MAGCPRPNKKAMQIAYKILNTPKNKQQKDEPNPSGNRINSWLRNTIR